MEQLLKTKPDKVTDSKMDYGVVLACYGLWSTTS